MNRVLSLFTLYLFLFTACTGDKTWLHSYKPMSADGWDRRDTICFPLPQAEENVNGILTLGLRITAPVSTQSIVLAVEQSLNAPATYRCDTVCYLLTDVEGDALGRGVNSIQYETQHLPFCLRKGQSGVVRIRHLMTKEIVPGITELGIKVSR